MTRLKYDNDIKIQIIINYCTETCWPLYQKKNCLCVCCAFALRRVQLSILENLVFLYIIQTSPCNEYPLTPHFYIVNLGFTGGIPYFLIFALNYRLLVGWLVLNVPVNNFSVMLGWSHRFLGIISTFW